MRKWKTDFVPKNIHAIYLLKAYLVWVAGSKREGEREEEGADGVLIVGVPFRVTLKSDKRETRVRFEITSMISDRNHNEKKILKSDWLSTALISS